MNITKKHSVVMVFFSNTGTNQESKLMMEFIIDSSFSMIACKETLFLW